MTKKKLEKPENMATESTCKVVSGVFDSNSLGDVAVGYFYLDGVRVGDGYNLDDVSVSDIDTNNIDHLTLKILSLLDDIQKPVAQYDISTHNKANEIRRELLGIAQEKRQPIKEQTLDEFNNARQVAYGNNVQVEPLTDQ